MNLGVLQNDNKKQSEDDILLTGMMENSSAKLLSSARHNVDSFCSDLSSLENSGHGRHNFAADKESTVFSCRWFSS